MKVPTHSDAAASGGTELASLTAVEMIAGYRQDAFTPNDVIDSVIVALERENKRLNIMVTDLFTTARAEAAQATADWKAGTPRGPLAGVPVSVKDLIYVGGAPAKGGAKALSDFIAPADAAVVERVRAAGGVITCKTTTCESGYKLTADSPLTGITRNPWNSDRTSGGSSGGAAAGVAAGCGPLALGTDGVGSIRVPSSFCGVFGFKPTFGLVPRAPSFSPPSWASLAHTGPITRTVADGALLLTVLAGEDIRDAASLRTGKTLYNADLQTLAGLRIAASVDFGYAAVDPEVRQAFAAALDILARLGASVQEDAIRLPGGLLHDVLQPIAFTEQAAAVNVRDATAFEGCEPEYMDVLLKGRGYSGVDYIEASYRRGALRGQFVNLFQSCDILVTPTVAVPAFAAGTLGVSQIDGKTVDAHLGWSPFTWPINLVGLPAATIPCGFSRDGLPIGLQIIAPWLNEQRILTVAAGLEDALGLR
eukprot:gene16557-16737_t